jgi:predicted dehydrogenase
MKPIKAAVVGTGFIGPVHVEAIRRLGHHVVGILGSSPERSEQAAEQLGIEQAYASFADLLNDSSVQVVHITSPNKAHFEQSKQAISAGKHVICEKPLAMNSRETLELVKLAETASVVTAVNYNVRFYPLILEARERRINGELGEIFHIVGSYLQDWLVLPTDFNWRVQSSEGGELRAVADIGTHWLDLICFITGLKVEAVFADLQTVHQQRFRPTGRTETFTGSAGGRGQPEEIVNVNTEDVGSVMIRFQGGARCAFTVSQVMAGRKNCIRFDIAASRASLAWNSEEPNNLTIGHRTRASEVLPRDPGLLQGLSRQYADYPGGHAEGFPDTFKQLYKAVYADIQALDAGHGKNPNPLYATFQDGHHEVRLCEAILQSHREQRWVKLD